MRPLWIAVVRARRAYSRRVATRFKTRVRRVWIAAVRARRAYSRRVAITFKTRVRRVWIAAVRVRRAWCRRVATTFKTRVRRVWIAAVRARRAWCRRAATRFKTRVRRVWIAAVRAQRAWCQPAPIKCRTRGETGVDCGGPCSACLTCSDGLQNQGETGVDCGGPCAACGSSCQSVALSRASATASTVESPSYAASFAIDGSLTTRWSSWFIDPQWLYVDLGSINRVRRVVLRWEAAASKDYDIQVSNAAAGPWTTVFSQPAGDGGVDDITGLNANARYVRMYSRQRVLNAGNSLFEFEIYGDSNLACGAGAACGNGVVDPGRDLRRQQYDQQRHLQQHLRPRDVHGRGSEPG